MLNTGIMIKLYKLDELSEKARQKAIEEHRQFELSIMSPDDFISGEAEYDTPEKLQKTYELEYDYYLYNDEPIIESIEANDYYFYEDGELADVTEHIKNNEVYKVELKLNGVIYDITHLIIEEA
jgi:mRNA-degrading endonuclease HigB of HigAB toxin-antitoxin module